MAGCEIMIEVFIKKPLYGTYVQVRDKYLLQAIREHTDIIIKTEVDGKQYSCTVSPLLWIRDGKKYLKEFLIPGKPMTLYGNSIMKYIDNSEK